MSLQGKTAIFENCSFFLFTMSAWYSVNLVERGLDGGDDNGKAPVKEVVDDVGLEYSNSFSVRHLLSVSLYLYSI